MRKKRTAEKGFTLFEVMIALSISLIAFAMAFSSFTALVKAWQRGTEMSDRLQHGNYVMEQLVAALRSASFYENSSDKYGFWLEDNGDDADVISWVTASPAFAAENSEAAQGTHRIFVTVDEADKDGLCVKLISHFADEERVEETEYELISREVIALNCRIYDFEEEDWVDEWEQSNSVPRRVELTLLTEPADADSDPVEFRRLVEIPIARAVGQQVESGAAASGGNTAQPARRSQQRGGGNAPSRGNTPVGVPTPAP